jgi:hypothetical protein
MFAPSFPCTPYNYEARFDNQSRSPFATTNPQPTSTKFQYVVDHLWDNVAAESDVRTIHISCHVNSNYSLDEFQRATLMPFDIPNVKSFTTSKPSTVPLTTLMPNLMERDRPLFAMIQNLDTELEKSHAGDCYRTEKCCMNCNRDWGPQSEILGRSYILHRLDLEWHALIRSRQQSDFLKTINAIPLMLKKSLLDDGGSPAVPSQNVLSRLNRIRQLLYIMQTDFIMQKRADRLVSLEDRKSFLSCEEYLDATYSDLQQCIRLIETKTVKSKETKGRLWRKRGVYQNPRCADWVLSNECTDNETAFKPEPNHLQRFGMMEHSIGGFNFGRQDDPNHIKSQISLGYPPPMHTDMFHNNAMKGFMSALAMIGKPESLTGHGIYDRVENPGAVIRCPSHPFDLYFCPTVANISAMDVTQQALTLLKKWEAAGCHSGLVVSIGRGSIWR